MLELTGMPLLVLVAVLVVVFPLVTVLWIDHFGAFADQGR